MLIRILMILGILALLFWVALWFLRRSLVKWLKHASAQANPQAGEQSTNKLNNSETLVKCAYCSTFIPQNRAMVVKDEYYCCEEHTTLSQ